METCSMEAAAVTDLRIEADDKSFEFLLSNIAVSENLTKLRDRIQELLKGEKYRQISSFNFTKQNIPISSQQENALTLGRIAQKVNGEKLSLVVYVKPVYADDRSSEIINKKGKLDNESVIPRHDQPRQKEVNETGYRVYSDADIKSSEGLELKKRLYWNDRVADFADGIKSNRISKFEAYGIIDVEWTRKQTELLRVMADEAIRTLQEKNIDPTIISRKSTCHEKDVVRAYERLNQSDFQLKRSYKKIEELHKKDKSHKKAELIKHEEENFDKLYSDLKCQQANMQKCLKVFQERESSDICDDKGTTSSVRVRSLEECEMQGLVEGIKDDYNVNDIPPEEEMQIVE